MIEHNFNVLEIQLVQANQHLQQHLADPMTRRGDRERERERERDRERERERERESIIYHYQIVIYIQVDQVHQLVLLIQSHQLDPLLLLNL